MLTTLPIRSVCTACHDSQAVAGHVELMTTASGLETCEFATARAASSMWSRFITESKAAQRLALARAQTRETSGGPGEGSSGPPFQTGNHESDVTL